MSKLFTIKKADYEITLKAEWIGNDLLLCLYGGDTPHIGTVTTFSGEFREIVSLQRAYMWIISQKNRSKHRFR